MTMTRAHLTQHFPQPEKLAEQRRAIYVDVSVLTESGEREESDMSEGCFLGAGGVSHQQVIEMFCFVCCLL